jgi:hypothetical protein
MAGKKAKGIIRKFVVLLSLVATGHFVVSFAAWLIALSFAIRIWQNGSKIDWLGFVDAIPAVVLLAASLITLVFVWKEKRGYMPLLLLTILLSAGFCAYDIINERWQIQMLTDAGCKYCYYTWWWYHLFTGR